jgi:TusA-related sulfurtransferase
MRFMAPVEEIEHGPSSGFDLEFKDLTREVCPMTFVRAKLYLEAMEAGERIGFILKEGIQARSVPSSLEEEGHLIESVQRLGDTYRVVVRKDGKRTLVSQSEI